MIEAFHADNVMSSGSVRPIKRIFPIDYSLLVNSNTERNETSVWIGNICAFFTLFQLIQQLETSRNYETIGAHNGISITTDIIASLPIT